MCVYEHGLFVFFPFLVLCSFTFEKLINLLPLLLIQPNPVLTLEASTTEQISRFHEEKVFRRWITKLTKKSRNTPTTYRRGGWKWDTGGAHQGGPDDQLRENEQEATKKADAWERTSNRTGEREAENSGEKSGTGEAQRGGRKTKTGREKANVGNKTGNYKLIPRTVTHLCVFAIRTRNMWHGPVNVRDSCLTEDDLIPAIPKTSLSIQIC